ncbi:hypothetical protein ES708_29563 [subsurface metagenome]
MNRDHVARSGANSLERHHDTAGDEQFFGDTVLKQAEHEIAHRIAPGDKSAQRPDGRRKQGPDAADIISHPCRHCHRHSGQARCVHVRIYIDSHHGDSKDQDKSRAKEDFPRLGKSIAKFRYFHPVQEKCQEYDNHKNCPGQV